jgi:hypothetical protein
VGRTATGLARIQRQIGDKGRWVVICFNDDEALKIADALVDLVENHPSVAR